MPPKCTKFTAEELHSLLHTLESNPQLKYIISSDSSTKLDKATAWRKIADLFNTMRETKSTATDLSSKWCYSKHRVFRKCYKIKARYSNNPHIKVPPVKLSFTEKRILTIVGSKYLHELDFDSESETINQVTSGSNPLVESTLIRAPYLVLLDSPAQHKSSNSCLSSSEMSPPASPGTEADISMQCQDFVGNNDASGYDEIINQASGETDLLPFVVSASSVKEEIEDTPNVQDHVEINVEEPNIQDFVGCQILSDVDVNDSVATTSNSPQPSSPKPKRRRSVDLNISNSVLTLAKPSKHKTKKKTKIGPQPVVLVSRLETKSAPITQASQKKKTSSNSKKIQKVQPKSKGKTPPSVPNEPQGFTQELQMMNHYLSSIALSNLEIMKYMRSMGQKQDKIIMLLSAALNIDDV